MDIAAYLQNKIQEQGRIALSSLVLKGEDLIQSATPSMERVLFLDNEVDKLWQGRLSYSRVCGVTNAVNSKTSPVCDEVIYPDQSCIYYHKGAHVWTNAEIVGFEGLMAYFDYVARVAGAERRAYSNANPEECSSEEQILKSYQEQLSEMGIEVVIQATAE